MIKINKKNIALTTIAFMFMALFSPMMTSKVEAANFTEASMRLDRMVISFAFDATDRILVVAKPATTGTEASIGLSFDADFTVDSTASNITVSTTGLPSTYNGESLTAWPGVGSAATAVSGQNVTFASTDATVSTLYGFYITGGITNPSSTGQKVSTLSTHSDATPDFTNYTDAIDSSRIATYIVTDNSTSTDDDQIVVTARVSPTYTLDLSANSITLDADLSTVEYPGGANNGAVSAVTATATTNANNGHIMWMKALTGTGLTSATTGTSIAFSGTAADATPTSLSAGTEGVVIDVDETTDTSGTLTVAGEFDGGSTSEGGTPSTTYQEIASGTSPAGTPGDVVTIIPRVAIAATTQAADDYTNTLTIVGAGDF